jgi:hypothetical protein
MVYYFYFMKVLIASQYYSTNSYVKNIVDPLTELCEVVTGVEVFWVSNLIFNVIHIQWPEELFEWKELKTDDLTRLKIRLEYLKKKGSKIAVTRHNEKSHRGYSLDQELYDLVFNFADCVVHLGSYSLNKFKGVDQKSVVIEHPLYSDLYQYCNPAKNRKELNLAEHSFIVLSVGKIRKKSEEKMVFSNFFKFRKKHPNSILLVLNPLKIYDLFPLKLNPVKKISKFILFNIKKFFLRFFGVILNSRVISDELMANYVNISNVIVLSRIDTLNSGVVFLGATFQKPVIGPRIGNILEALELTNNYSFNPHDEASLYLELLKIKESPIHQKGAANIEILNPGLIAKKHFELYQELSPAII